MHVRVDEIMGRAFLIGLAGVFATLIVGIVLGHYYVASYLAYFPMLVIVFSLFLLVTNLEWFMTDPSTHENRAAESIRLKLHILRGRADREVNIDVFLNPSKYLKRLPLEEIVADTRVYRKGVERYKEKIANGESVPPIIVVEHPTKEVYAVLDGHHRYYAYVELGRREIECALAGNASRVIFYMTKHGVFQPPSEVTEHIRVPALKFNAEVKQFLSDFLEDPDGIQKSTDDYITRIRSTPPNKTKTIEEHAPV